MGGGAGAPVQTYKPPASAGTPTAYQRLPIKPPAVKPPTAAAPPASAPSVSAVVLDDDAFLGLDDDALLALADDGTWMDSAEVSVRAPTSARSLAVPPAPGKRAPPVAPPTRQLPRKLAKTPTPAAAPAPAWGPAPVAPRPPLAPVPHVVPVYDVDALDDVGAVDDCADWDYLPSVNAALAAAPPTGRQSTKRSEPAPAVATEVTKRSRMLGSGGDAAASVAAPATVGLRDLQAPSRQTATVRVRDGLNRALQHDHGSQTKSLGSMCPPPYSTGTAGNAAGQAGARQRRVCA